QRALAFLPLELSADARTDAEGSSEWRLEMWKGLLPQVPQHLLLGKGYAITQEDFQMMGMDTSFRSADASQQGLALSFDYHNGPLSVVIPFGIWGFVAFCWFLWSTCWVMYSNFRYGDPALKTINTFLFADLIRHVLMFFT